MKRVWEGLNLMSGCKKEKLSKVEKRTLNYANDLNSFYAGFDCHDFHRERDQMVADLVRRGSKVGDSKKIVVSEEEVLQELKNVNPHKAAGCAQLYKILCRIFNRSLDYSEVP